MVNFSAYINHAVRWTDPRLVEQSDGLHRLRLEPASCRISVSVRLVPMLSRFGRGLH